MQLEHTGKSKTALKTSVMHQKHDALSVQPFIWAIAGQKLPMWQCGSCMLAGGWYGFPAVPASHYPSLPSRQIALP